MRILFLITLFFVLSFDAAMAAPEQDAKSPLVRLDQKTDELLKDLNKDQVTQFEKIRTAHGTIRAVDDVRVSLSRAVESCIQNNPDLKEPMTTRLQAWKNFVLPVVRQGQNRLEKMILMQSFTRPSTLRGYLKVFDDAVKYKETPYTEVPISAEKDCKVLIKNMAESEVVMHKLITETLGLDQPLTQEDGTEAKNK